MVNVDELYVLEDLRRDLFLIAQVLFVLGGQDHSADAPAVRRQDLLAHSADAQDRATQGDLTGHRQVVADRPATHCGD